MKSDKAGPGALEIREVESAKDLRNFISVPWEIYRDDPNWIPPLRFERKQALSPGHPYFKHARWKAWVAWRDGKPVGRISAQVDDLYLERYGTPTGYFGLIEAPDEADVFEALFAAAESWLRQQGMTEVIGPFNLGINQEMGLLVEGWETPPYVMMGHGRPYYGSRVEAQGYQQATDTLAYVIDHEGFKMPAAVGKLLDRLGERVKVRQVDRKRTTDELAVMQDIFNDAWSQNWGYVPFTRDEFFAVGKEMFMIVPRDYTWIAEVDGEPAAFIVLLPNINEAIADLNGRILPFGWAKLLWRLKVKGTRTGRVALMGVRQEYQKTRIGPALAFLAMQALYEPTKRRGIREAEMSWILEQNHDMRKIAERIGGRVSKRYRLYRKELT